jgi:26S proteasome regulatory subunit N9
MEQWIEQQLTLFPEQSTHYTDLSGYYHQKLWNQMGKKLLVVTQMPFFQNNKSLIHLYENFVKKFEKSLNPLEFSQFAVAVAKQYDDVSGAIGYLDKVLMTVANNSQAAVIIKSNIVRNKLQLNKLEEAKIMLEELKVSIEGYIGIMESICHSQFFLAQLEFYKVKSSPGDYFRNCLLYLDYTPLNTISDSQQLTIAYDVGLAALIGDSIYNFGELLQHPILKVLQGTRNEWLSQLLFVFNVGDLDRFKSILSAEEKSQPILSKNFEFLYQKIRIMGLMEMCFKRSTVSRTLTFKDIASTCGLPLESVELLLMKAFSLKVVKGQIDQVDQTVRIKWVQPRVLDLDQTRGIRDRLKIWSADVHKTANYLQENFGTAL